MPRNKTQKKGKKTVGGTLTGKYDRGSQFDNYFRDYWGNNQMYNDFVKSLQTSETNYTTGKVMNLFKNNEGYKVMNELNAEKAKQKPPSPKKESPKSPSTKTKKESPKSPSPKTKKESPKSPSTKTINNCPSAGVEPVECTEPKDLKKQRFIFHPDKNSGCVKDAENKFKRLISDEFPNCKNFDSN